MVKRLLQYMKEQELDGFYVSSGINVSYISGYTGDDSCLFVTPDCYYFLTDPRYTEQAEKECPDYKIVDVRGYTGGVSKLINDLSADLKIKRIGFEEDEVSYQTYRTLTAESKVEWVPTSGVIEDMRMIKTPQEIQYLRNACDISCRAFERIIKDIRPGVTEKELAAKLSLYMVMEGADTMPYGNILISGARTSLLHGIPSSKAIEYGDFVLMDFGCQYKGYLSDMTRTVIVGKPTAMQKEVYELEKRMVEDSLAVMKAGVPVCDVYQASIEAIKDTEYMKYHYTGIGHGIGRFVHEPPFMGPRSNVKLQAGNVRTIEPGLYIPDWGGVRIEDQVLITEDGYENMISTTHELIEL